jgi:peptidoglycan/xylan/chitin deacetylase (PgdA/CDA1 family)
MSLLKQVKRRTLTVSKRVGLFEVLRRSAWRRNRLTILCYHGVSIGDEHLWNPSYYMSPEAFEGRLRLLREGGYSILLLREAVERLHEGTLPAGCVALTFDDGMYDFYSKVWPLLRAYDIPATVYLTTYYSTARSSASSARTCCGWVGGGRSISAS